MYMGAPRRFKHAGIAEFGGSVRLIAQWWHMSMIGPRRRAWTGRGVWLCWLALLPACGRSDAPWLAECSPQTPRELRQALTEAQPQGFAEACRRAGVQRMLQLHTDLLTAARAETPAQSTARFRRMGPYLDRIAARLAVDYRYPTAQTTVEWLRTLEAHQLHRWLTLRADLLTLLDTRVTTPEAQLERVLALQSQFEAMGYRGANANLFGHLADVYGTAGDAVAQERWVRRAIAAARETQAYTLLAQQLGVLGELHQRHGQLDSMTICWDEALEVAKHMRHAEQAARITSFYADHFSRQGRPEVAQEWFEASARLCREYQGETIEARYLLRAGRFYAELGCWDIVGRHVQRSLKLLDDATALSDSSSLRLHRFDAGMLAACRQMALGEVEAADRAFGRLTQSVQTLRLFQLRANELHLRWAQGLASHGRWARAQEVAQQGLAEARRSGDTVTEAGLGLVVARAALGRGIPAECVAELERFAALARADPGTSRAAWVQHDALRIRAIAAGGDTSSARRALVEAMERLRSFAAATDASPAGYLFLDSCRELRLAGHALWAHDARRGLLFEREWRTLGSLLGGGTSESSAPAAVSEPDRRRDRASPAHELRPVGPGDIALQYLVTGDDIVRWTTTAAGLRVERLGLDPRGLERRIAELALTLQNEHCVAIDSLHATLAQLAAQLLPPEVWLPTPQAARMPTLSVVTDAAVTLVPFAALAVERQPYCPLVERFDIVNERGLPTPGCDARAGPAVVVASPLIADAVRVQYQLPELSQSGAEGRRWASVQRNALVLADSAATRRRVLEVWQQARSIYFATHVAQNPEIPYLQFVPLAHDPSSGAVANLLDVVDIRAADLSGCGLVVLSACRSGAPYLVAQSQGASLAEAFLDAGASVVISTLWPVRDQAARQIMDGFTAAWSTNGEDAVAALNAALRLQLARTRTAGTDAPAGASVASSLEWTAYGVQVRRWH